MRGSDVDLVMVDGRILVEDGRLKTADMAQLIGDVRGLAPACSRGAQLGWHKTSMGPCSGPTPTGADGELLSRCIQGGIRVELKISDAAPRVERPTSVLEAIAVLANSADRARVVPRPGRNAWRR